MSFVEKGDKNMETKNIGQFCGSVLLSEDCWDRKQLLAQLEEEWEIDFSSGDSLIDEVSIVGEVDGCEVVISKFPVPVPDQEAEINAENNFMWEDAVEVARRHKAHIVVAVLGNEGSPLERGIIYTKILATCTKQKSAIGVFASGVVFEPSYYYEAAQLIKENVVPVANLVWIGLYGSDEGISAYTYGMEDFGKREMEIINSKKGLEEVYDFIASIAAYVLADDVELKDEETIGFSENDKHKIVCSQGVAFPDIDTLKITD